MSVKTHRPFGRVVVTDRDDDTLTVEEWGESHVLYMEMEEEAVTLTPEDAGELGRALVQWARDRGVQ